MSDIDHLSFSVGERVRFSYETRYPITNSDGKFDYISKRTSCLGVIVSLSLYHELHGLFGSCTIRSDRPFICDYRIDVDRLEKLEVDSTVKVNLPDITPGIE